MIKATNENRFFLLDQREKLKKMHSEMFHYLNLYNIFFNKKYRETYISLCTFLRELDDKLGLSNVYY